MANFKFKTAGCIGLFDKDESSDTIWLFQENSGNYIQFYTIIF